MKQIPSTITEQGAPQGAQMTSYHFAFEARERGAIGLPSFFNIEVIATSPAAASLALYDYLDHVHKPRCTSAWRDGQEVFLTDDEIDRVTPYVRSLEAQRVARVLSAEPGPNAREYAAQFLTD